MARGKRNNNSKSNGATLGFKALWAAAFKILNNAMALRTQIASAMILIKI